MPAVARRFLPACLIWLASALPSASQDVPLPASPSIPNPPSAIQNPRLDARGDPLPPGAVARLGTNRLRHAGPVSAVGFTRDGRCVVSAGEDSVVAFWDASTGRPVARARSGDGDAINDLVFLPDGSLLVAAANGEIRLWKVENRTDNPSTDVRLAGQGRLLGQTTEARRLAISPDGRCLAAACSEGGIQRLRLSSGEDLGTLQGHKGAVRGVAYSPDGETLASAGEDHTVRLWSVESGQELRRLEGHENEVWEVAFSPDGKTLGSVSSDKTVRLWDVQTGRRVRALEGHEDVVAACAFSPDGHTLATGGHDRTVRLWDAPSGRELRKLEGHAGVVLAVAFSPDGKTLASAGDDHTVRLWDPATGKERFPTAGHAGAVYRLEFSPDGRTVVSAGEDGVVRLWDPDDGRVLREMPRQSGELHALALSPDGRTLAAGGSETPLTIYGTDPGANPRILMEQKDADDVNALAFSPDGKTLAVAYEQKRIEIWDAAQGRRIGSFDAPEHSVEAVAFTRDGGTLVAGAGAKEIHLWEVATGRETHHPIEIEEVFGACLSGDGRTLAVSGKGEIRLVDTATGRELVTLEGFEGGEGDFYDDVFAFTRDARVFARLHTGAIELVEATTGLSLGRLEASGGDVTAMAFSPNGRRLATAMQDTTILVWDVGSVGGGTERARGGAAPGDLEALWADLGGADAASAWRAAGALAESGERAAAFLKSRLQAPPEDDRLPTLVRELDDDRAPIRERATREIERLGPAAEPALRKALAETASAEVRARLEVVLDHLKGGEPLATGEPLRWLRAVQALERLAGAVPAARETLESLANGPAAALLTREARAALLRLNGPERR